MDPLCENRLHVTRREFFGRGACGIGTAALASLLGPSLAPGAAGVPHFAPKAKRVI